MADLWLEEKLKTQQPKLFDILEAIKKSCHEIWKDRLLPWFTNHDCEHSAEVVYILGQILEPIKGHDTFLTGHELFILLSGAYLHDIGMQCLKVNGLAIDKLTEAEYDKIRKMHAESSYRIILQRLDPKLDRDDFHLPSIDEEYLPVIARISKGHSTDFFEEIISECKNDPPACKNRPVRGELLVSLLMIADELDLSRKRVDFAETAKFKLSNFSLLHWYKHHYIDLVNVENGTITIVLRFPPNADDYEALFKELIDVKLREQIDRANPYLRASSKGLLHLNLEIVFNIRTDITNFARELPEEVLPELKKVLGKNTVSEHSGTELNKTFPIIPKPSLIFTGREEDKRKFKKVFDNASFLSIEGLGGIGKTEFAAKCVEELPPKKQVVWFECLLGSKLDSLIEYSGYPEVLKGDNKTELAKYSGFRDLIERDNKVIFLDNFQDILDESFKDFFKMSEKYLRNAKIIIISREHPDIGIRVAPVELEGLKDDALLYARKLVETYYSNVRESDDVLHQICDNVEGHPLAIDLSLQLLSYGESPDQIIRKIIDSPDKSTELSRRLLDEIFDHPKSTAEEKRLLLNFSVFRAEVEKKGIAYLFGEPALDMTLRSLYDKKMLSRSKEFFGTHPLIREFCYQRLEDKKAMHWKAAEYFKAQRKEHFVTLLEEEQYYHLFTGEFYEESAELVCQTGEGFVRTGHTNTLLEMVNKVKSKGIDRAEFYVFLGDISTIRGEWPEATSYYEQAFLFAGVAEKIMAEAYVKLGEILYLKGSVKEALKYFEDARDICLKGGYKKELARAIDDIGQCYKTFGNLTLAETHHISAIEIRREIDDREGLATSFIRIGRILKIRGELDAALDKYNQSLSIFQEIEDKQGIASSLSNIGQIFRHRGELDAALGKYNESLAISKR
jgi:tetratricopeptide (TPR) repeat protein